ncbi:uncharacterized protein PV09_00915, partial [Verruconis gallopava]
MCVCSEVVDGRLKMSIAADFRRQLRALQSLVHRARAEQGRHELDNSLVTRLTDVLLRTWDLGFTAFGGPAVHFKILFDRFVVGGAGKGQKWIDEQTYQELFAICQALPGPGSTKMLFCIALVRAGVVPAVVVFLVWSLPGALAMYGLSLGVERMSEILPSPVYALLSGLNASTVGIIALAAVQLAEKAIRDRWTRILVLFGACAGLCYNSLWYFPVLLVAGGISTLLWDGYVRVWIARMVTRYRRSGQREDDEAADHPSSTLAIDEHRDSSQSGPVQRRVSTPTSDHQQHDGQNSPVNFHRLSMTDGPPEAAPLKHPISVRVGICLVVGFLASFIATMIVRGMVKPLPRAAALFANMYLAGTIIFGGGPVVIPLLRSYVVGPGWVSSRDFLIGLAIIQAMPGPNFNFAVYLGALAIQKTPASSLLGALMGFLGIFVPGIVLAVAFQSFWQVLRTRQWVLDVLRGINATAVGLVFTAVYRLWEIGYLTPDASQGVSLALEPWWVVVTAVSYAESAWFNVPPAISIVIGAVLGLCWYGAVKA